MHRLVNTAFECPAWIEIAAPEAIPEMASGSVRSLKAEIQAFNGMVMGIWGI
ncbi:MAG: hypothetical protein O3C32_05350 [Bacteroidetes bacterium]|jgi:hypothetical protein|nr:hypothetical protein [Bacteroidota bacterium]